MVDHYRLFFLFCFRMLLFTFMLPIIVSVFFSLAVGHDPRHLAFGVVNSELDNSLINCPKVYPTDRCIFEDNITISCAFIKEIQGRDYRLVRIFPLRYFCPTKKRRLKVMMQRVQTLKNTRFNV